MKMARYWILTVISLLVCVACVSLSVGCVTSNGEPSGNSEIDNVHAHVWSSQWSYNGTHHWRICEVAGCEATRDNESHDDTRFVCQCGNVNVPETD